MSEFEFVLGSSNAETFADVASGDKIWLVCGDRRISATLGSTRPRGRPSLMPANGALLEEMSSLVQDGMSRTEAAREFTNRAVGNSEDAKIRWLIRRYGEKSKD